MGFLPLLREEETISFALSLFGIKASSCFNSEEERENTFFTKKEATDVLFPASIISTISPLIFQYLEPVSIPNPPCVRTFFYLRGANLFLIITQFNEKHNSCNKCRQKVNYLLYCKCYILQIYFHLVYKNIPYMLLRNKISEKTFYIFYIKKLKQI